MSRMMTSADVAAELQYADRRAARRVMRELRAVLVGRQYRLPRETFEEWLCDPSRITGRPDAVPAAATALPTDRRQVRDPYEPSPAGWWREETQP